METRCLYMKNERQLIRAIKWLKLDCDFSGSFTSSKYRGYKSQGRKKTIGLGYKEYIILVFTDFPKKYHTLYTGTINL